MNILFVFYLIFSCVLSAANRKLIDAPKLLIVGGGPVGVELAGEIVVDFPQKKVDLNLHVSISMFLFKFRCLQIWLE